MRRSERANQKRRDVFVMHFAQENDSLSLRAFSPALRQGTKKSLLFSASTDKDREKRILGEKTVDHVSEKKDAFSWNESR